MACEEGAEPRRVIEPSRHFTHEAPESTLAALRLGTQHEQSDCDGYPAVKCLFLVDADVEHVALALGGWPAPGGFPPPGEGGGGGGGLLGRGGGWRRESRRG